MAAGRMTESWIARAEFLKAQVRYIYSLDVRFATRWSRSLKTGSPAEAWTGLDECEALFICVPDDRLDDVLHSLRRSLWQGRNRPVVLCDSSLDSSGLRLLEPFQVSAASLNWLDGFEDRRFVAEGAPAAMKYLRRLFQGSQAKLHEVPTESRDLFLAALDLAHLTFPLLAAAYEGLRRAQVSAEQALLITERIALRNSRGFAKAGKKAWLGPAFHGDPADIEKRVRELRRHEPLFADLLAANVDLAWAFLGLEENAVEVKPRKTEVAAPRARTATAAAS